MDAPPCREQMYVPGSGEHFAKTVQHCSQLGAMALPPTPKISSCATAHCIGPTAKSLTLP